MKLYKKCVATNPNSRPIISKILENVDLWNIDYLEKSGYTETRNIIQLAV
jgi:hypothetical protein